MSASIATAVCAICSALVASPQANDRYRLNRALVELALGQTEAALADAPGMDEPGLRQTLAIYQTPPRDTASANIDQLRDTATNVSDGEPIPARQESPLPNVHLAVDPPAASPAAAEKTAASIQPAAGSSATAAP